MHLREVELGPISEVEIDRDQAELGLRAHRRGAQANLILVIGYSRYSVFSFSRDRSRSGIKPCNHKNQIWDKSRNKWYLSHSGCGIKSGIHTTFLARTCGLVSRRACTLGQARALAMASTPARRFCATRPCTLYFLGLVS